MNHRKRRFFRALTAFSIVAGLPFAGGAWLQPTGVEPVPRSQVAVPPDTLLLSAFPQEPAGQNVVPPATPSTLPWFSEPRRTAAVEEWFGCAPPRERTVCVEPGLTPAEQVEALVPDAPAALEDWRPLIEHFFEAPDVDRALQVVQCESRGDRWAKNPSSTASGLFQHLRSLWPPRARSAGYAGANVFDPVANVAVAAWLVYDNGGWSHWNPSRGCWR
jgi:hypothetical protein